MQLCCNKSIRGNFYLPLLKIIFYIIIARTVTLMQLCCNQSTRGNLYLSLLKKCYLINESTLFCFEPVYHLHLHSVCLNMPHLIPTWSPCGPTWSPLGSTWILPWDPFEMPLGILRDKVPLRDPPCCDSQYLFTSAAHLLSTPVQASSRLGSKR